MENISISIISEKKFLDIRDKWNSLLEKSVTNEVFLSWEWIYAWWDIFKDINKKLYILIGKNSNEDIIGIAPFYIENKSVLGLFNRKIIRFCSALETYPDHLDLIYEKKYEDLFSYGVINYLKENDSEWDLIKLDGVKDNSIIKRHLISTNTNACDLIIDCVHESKCPYININQSFEDYLKTFSGKTKYTILKKRKKLMEKEDIVFKIVNPTEDPEKYTKELFLLHAERAKRKRIKTSFYGNKIYNFHRNFISYLLLDNKIIIASLYKNTTPLVSYYCIKYNNKYYYYQSGISCEGEEKSAGSVLLLLLIEKAFKEGCGEFDLLRGDEKYKYLWTKTFRQNYSIIIRKNNLIGKITNYISNIYRKINKLVTLYIKNIITDYFKKL